jgi:hypothetical protein
VRSIELAARLLRIAAIVAAAIWVIGAVASAVYVWDLTGQFSSSSFTPGDVFAESSLDEDFGRRVSQTVSSTVSATWGYALVAIVALAGWLYAESRRASVFLDALDEIEGARPSVPPMSSPSGPADPAPPFTPPRPPEH